MIYEQLPLLVVGPLDLVADQHPGPSGCAPSATVRYARKLSSDLVQRHSRRVELTDRIVRLNNTLYTAFPLSLACTR